MPSILIEQDSIGLRLDKLLCKKFDISFGLAQKIIREKKIKVNGARVPGDYRVEDQDQVEVYADLKDRLEKHGKKTTISTDKMKKFSSYIIFEDENMVAIDKPSGLATQGGSGIDVSVDDFVTTKKWQLVHRLDKDTSGVLLIAKNPQTAEMLTDAFKNKTIEKTYLALLHGNVKKDEGVINIPLRKKISGKNEKVSPDFEQGKEAISKFKIIRRFESYCIAELSPLTGRTHQLRVHCKELGHPIINDVKYGGMKVLHKDLCKRLCLHAYRIKIADYFGKELKIETRKPEFL